MKRLTFSLAALMLAIAPVSLAEAKQKCPPGLAKKNPPCVPPGLAKKGGGSDREVRYDDDHSRDTDRIIWGSDGWRDRYRDRYGRDYYDDPVYVLGPDGRLYEVGERIARGSYVLVPVEDLLHLPLVADGHTYVKVGGKIVEMVETTGLIVRTLGAVHDLLN